MSSEERRGMWLAIACYTTWGIFPLYFRLLAPVLEGGIEGRPDPYGVPYYWIVDYASDAPHRRDTDLSAIGAGAIAVTPLHLDFTHHPTLAGFRDLFA